MEILELIKLLEWEAANEPEFIIPTVLAAFILLAYAARRDR